MKNEIYDFLDVQEFSSFEGNEKRIELDYEWNYQDDPVITPTIISEWEYLNKLIGKEILKNASKVLSIGGGGSSQTHLFLGEETKEFYIINPGFWDLENAKLPNEKIKSVLVRGIAEELPFKDGTIDAIEIPATLDHMVSPKRAIEESIRVLKSNGKIGITLGNRNSWYRGLVRSLGIKEGENHDHHHNFHFSIVQVEDLLVAAGFEEIRTIGTAFLKLPKFIERIIRNPLPLRVHNVISNRALPLLFGNRRGGMFLTYGIKP